MDFHGRQIKEPDESRKAIRPAGGAENDVRVLFSALQH